MPTAYFLVADVTANWPSGSAWMVLGPLAVIVLAVVGYALVDLVRAPSAKYLPKAVWAIIIVLASMPLGALVYLVVGRDRSAQVPPVVSQAGESARQTGDDTAPAAVPAADTPALGIAAQGQDEKAHAGPRAAPTSAPTSASASASDDDAGDRVAGAILETFGLTRDYGGTGLFDVDLIVPRGCVYGLVGPNGAGKTTLLSLLTGTRHADRGTIRMAVSRRRIAVCPDVPEFDLWLTAWEAVDLALALTEDASTDRTDRTERVSRALAEAGLAAAADTRVGGFSRGMTQRLGLACALVADPELLILDEPTSALDPAGRADVLQLVGALRGRRTVIFSSHILADVQRVADRVGILREGRLLYQGLTRTLIDDHLQPRWLVRIAGDTSALRADLARRPWVTTVVDAGSGALHVEAVSIEAGERGIPAAVAACEERLVSLEPVAADLESAFLALTERRPEPSGVRT